MSTLGTVFTVVLLSAGLGALGLSLLTLLVHWLWVPRAVTDGMYALVFGVTVPCGALLGIASGLGIYFTFGRKPVFAGWSGLPVGVLVLIAAVGLLLFLVSEENNLTDILESFCYWFGLPTLWAAALLLRSLLFLRSA